MSTDSREQGQDFCSILVLTDEGITKKQSESRFSLSTYLEVQQTQMFLDAQMSLQNSTEHGKESENTYSPCSVNADIEKGTPGTFKINEETGGSVKTEIALTKALRRQNSLQTGGKYVPPLMNHILMLLNFDPKDKAAMEKAHDSPNNKWRKYKRAASFDSRQIVLLFSILSSMGTIVLIYLTLRARQAGDGFVHA
ncbi:hypothetical protein Nepgr_027156 [Nepenthes gracilis]|uniref:Uncharacterized protein n=1 Tax=Nepenthes gracilis TaxID=150966 RepID=A0AAD3T9V4_NEPGR|nr:hypothetical protein Nepgr_027156 [Nepenthes gracilis]